MRRFTIEELVGNLRSAVAVDQAENAGEDGLVEDLAYAAMSDEELITYLKIAATRDFGDYPLDKIPEEAVYPVTLLARRELYFSLASRAAPLYNLQADGATLSQTQRFEHYLLLIKQIDDEIKDWEENSGGTSGTNGTLTSYTVQLPNRYNTLYNQRTATPPAVILYVDEIGTDYVNISWKPTYHTVAFQYYKVYCSNEGNVFDDYRSSNAKISDSAVLVGYIKDIWQKSWRIRGLEPATQYSIGVMVSANGGKKAYDLDTITTEELPTLDTIGGGE